MGQEARRVAGARYRDALAAYERHRAEYLALDRCDRGPGSRMRHLLAQFEKLIRVHIKTDLTREEEQRVDACAAEMVAHAGVLGETAYYMNHIMPGVARAVFHAALHTLCHEPDVAAAELPDNVARRQFTARMLEHATPRMDMRDPDWHAVYQLCMRGLEAAEQPIHAVFFVDTVFRFPARYTPTELDRARCEAARLWRAMQAGEVTGVRFVHYAPPRGYEP